MNYANDHIRNVMLAGHSGSGKTTLAEAMLYLTKGTDRFGRVEDGNTVCDFDPEEIKRHTSLSMALAPVEYDGVKINLIDTPGPVSYTHLDVYKRQVWKLAPPNRPVIDNTFVWAFYRKSFPKGVPWPTEPFWRHPDAHW